MNLISVRLGIPNFGLCSGMGSCGTCFVEIVEPQTNYTTTALSCAVKIDDELANAIIKIQESFY